jgi:hypothetical protein
LRCDDDRAGWRSSDAGHGPRPSCDNSPLPAVTARRGPGSAAEVIRKNRCRTIELSRFGETLAKRPPTGDQVVCLGRDQAASSGPGGSNWGAFAIKYRLPEDCHLGEVPAATCCFHTVSESVTKIFLRPCDSNHSACRGPMSTLGFGTEGAMENERRPCCAGLRKPSGDGSWNSRRSAPASASGQWSQASSRVFLTTGPAGACAFHC